MSDSPIHPATPAPPVTDDDLLANAIPIDEAELADDGAIEVSIAPDAVSKIRRFDAPRRQQTWARKPNVTGSGAVHVKTFVAKMRPEAIDHMDEQINDWLDAHPEVEVKFVTTSVGRLVGKTTEDAMVVNVWV